ncbi:uncharacterized protein FIBRA_08902 [Fibroporia radiculosa]|uniref:Uncharacterized protein n=1 Tax=Fibroporia radiculosa TaxID=599839 RepID=J4I3H7_9APHY|nr:uncharacterized protein FIBRA_08902 [Fibroporia radiculosa]CCM06622.1 predicted protein [Fibroporia radiculosa]
MAKPIPTLDDPDKYYALDDDEITFFKSQTGINDDAALKSHILHVQAQAYEVCTRILASGT